MTNSPIGARAHERVTLFHRDDAAPVPPEVSACPYGEPKTRRNHDCPEQRKQATRRHDPRRQDWRQPTRRRQEHGAGEERDYMQGPRADRFPPARRFSVARGDGPEDCPAQPHGRNEKAERKSQGQLQGTQKCVLIGSDQGRQTSGASNTSAKARLSAVSTSFMLAAIPSSAREVTPCSAIPHGTIPR